MKKLMIIFSIGAALMASAPQAYAGGNKWAVNFGGFFGGVGVSAAYAPVPVYQAPVVCAPAPAVVYTAPPPPQVIVRPAAVVAYRQPVYMPAAPVYVALPPRMVMAPPAVGFWVGYGPRYHHHHPVARVCR